VEENEGGGEVAAAERLDHSHTARHRHCEATTKEARAGRVFGFADTRDERCTHCERMNVSQTIFNVYLSLMETKQ